MSFGSRGLFFFIEPYSRFANEDHACRLEGLFDSFVVHTIQFRFTILKAIDRAD